MMLPSSSLFGALSLGFALLQTKVNAATWSLSTTINPTDFDNQFNYYNQTDPTHGLVLYQDYQDAKANNLTGIAHGNYFMRVDTTEVQLAGRRSIRLESKQTYQDGVYVLNVSHVPIGCAAWPAFWTLTENESAWPQGGEIDILENFNDLYNGPAATLHTQDSCIVPKASESGMLLSNNCSAYTPNNDGCSVVMNGTSKPTWGTAFNQQGGGIVAMERALGSTGSGIRVWIWPQGQEPSDLQSSSNSVDPSTWGTPNADFNVANNCHTEFGPHRIIFDITLCGDAGSRTYNTSGCNLQYPACSYQVGYNGSSFNQSYWSLGGLRVFATGGGTDNAQTSPNTHKEVFTSLSAASLMSVPVQAGSLITLLLCGAALLLI
ncbi:uncharacterized protein FA14DRAFT_130746, partial [Meira miltonrushii]